MSIYCTKYKSLSKSKRRRRSKSRRRCGKSKSCNKSRRRCGKSKRRRSKDGGIVSRIKKLFISPEPPINIDKCSEGMKTLIDFDKYSKKEELEQRIIEYCSKTKYIDILLFVYSFNNILYIILISSI